MNDNIYINQITLLLHAFAQQVKTLGKLNLHDCNVNAEYFFRDFLNELKGWELFNANDLKRNEGGIDLVDNNKKIIIQVSSTATKEKVQTSIYKTDKTKYNEYRLYFLFIIDSAKNLKTNNYNVPSNFVFEPLTDIWDIDNIISMVQSALITTKENLHNLTTKHLTPVCVPARNATSLAKVVEILAAEINASGIPITKDSFLIEQKILLNKLEAIRGTIQDHSVYSSMLNRIYESNESCCRFVRQSIHSSLRKVYEDNKATKTPSDLYRHISKHAYSVVLNSFNRPSDMMIDDIAWCVEVIVADAFEACKIFEHPKNL